MDAADDSNTILTLYSANELTERLLNSEHNATHFTPASYRAPLSPVGFRDETPSGAEDDDQLPFLPAAIRLQFKEEPRNYQRGFTFGSDPAVCDILLAGRLVSGIHFSVTFDANDRLCLIDTSKHGTWVSFNRQRSVRPRHHFKWLLETGHVIDIEFGGRSPLRFKAAVPRHQYDEAAFQTNLARFIRRQNSRHPHLDLLDLSSRETSAQASGDLSPTQQPWYYIERELGSGSYSVVKLARNISTGELYAIKELKKERKSVASLDEFDTLHLLQHDHIIRYIQSLGAGRMVIEYIALGSLTDEHRRTPITPQENVVILRQALQALAFLHGKGYTHRDIKPDNVLVKSRQDPLHIKLADFGLVQQNHLLRTRCGTDYYAAPEIWVRQEEKGKGLCAYTPVVDIWSLGVVVLQYARGHPKHREDISPAEWCKTLVETANTVNNDPLMDLLCCNMLILNPAHRTSASKCLRLALQIPTDLGGAEPQTAEPLESANNDKDHKSWWTTQGSTFA